MPQAETDYPTVAPEDLAAIVEALDPNPAYLIGPRMDVLAWNAAAGRVLGVPTAAPDGSQNLLWFLFTSDQQYAPTWEQTGRSMLARFRAEHARRYDEPAFRELIEALLATSPRFRELWPRHEVESGQLGTKSFEHPTLGQLDLLHLQSIPTSHPDLRFTQLVPRDEATRKALAG